MIPRVEAADLAATPVSQIPVDSPARVAVLDLARQNPTYRKQNEFEKKV